MINLTDSIELLGRLDSNQRMAVPKTAALPLGDAPTHKEAFESNERGRKISKIPDKSKREMSFVENSHEMLGFMAYALL